MKGLLLVVHGSRMDAAKDEIFNVAGKLRGLLSDQYDVVSAAFLQAASPSLSEAIQEQVDGGGAADRRGSLPPGHGPARGRGYSGSA